MGKPHLGPHLGPSARRHSGWVRPLVIAAALIAVAVGAILWAQPKGSPGGLPRKVPVTTYTTYPLDPGNALFSMGSIYIRGPDADVEILRVEALHSDNVEVAGTYAVWPSDHRDFGYAGGAGGGFPLKHQAQHHPAVGVIVPRAEFTHIPKGWDEPAPLTVTVGFRIREGERGAMNGVVIVYRVGDRVVREHIPQAVIACVKPLTSCTPGAEDDPEASKNFLRRLGLVTG